MQNLLFPLHPGTTLNIHAYDTLCLLWCEIESMIAPYLARSWALGNEQGLAPWGYYQVIPCPGRVQWPQTFLASWNTALSYSAHWERSSIHWTNLAPLAAFQCIVIYRFARTRDTSTNLVVILHSWGFGNSPNKQTSGAYGIDLWVTSPIHSTSLQYSRSEWQDHTK